MAHAVGDAGNRVDINLTPLLDVVLQLIMFFMITINFQTHQYNMNVHLAQSISAREIPAKTDTDYIVVNIEVVRVDHPTKKDDRQRPVKIPKDPPEWVISVQPYGDLRTQWVDDRGRMTGEKKITFNPLGSGMSRTQPNRRNMDVAIEEAMKALKLIATNIRDRDKVKVGTSKKEGEEGSITLAVPIRIRNDAESNYEIVVALMAQAKREGYEKVQLHAETLTKR